MSDGTGEKGDSSKTRDAIAYMAKKEREHEQQCGRKDPGSKEAEQRFRDATTKGERRSQRR